MKYLFLTIILLFGIFLIAGSVNAATEFISTIQQTSGDYSTLSSWEAAVQSDLTATTTRVFSGTGTGELSNGDTVTCVSGGVHNGIMARVVATTTTQILLDNATSSTDVVLSATDKWQKDASNYFTVSGTGSELGDTAIAIAKIDGAWSSADQTGVEIDGWSTDSTHYIRIYTTTAARHNGKWDTSKYRLVVSNAGVLGTEEAYTRIEGLQLAVTNDTADRYVLFFGVGSDNSKAEKNIVKGTGTTYSTGITFYEDHAPDCIAANNIVYDCKTGLSRIGYGDWADHTAYNNTIYNCATGVSVPSGWETAILSLKNNIVNSCTTCYNIVGVVDSTNNISEDATSPDGASYQNKSVSFVDESGDDFHLAAGDTAAKNAGTNLYSDANLQVTDDIDGDTRPASNWDIGADEEMTAVEFVSTIMQGTVGDYHTLSEWEGAIDCDLTSSSTRVYSFDNNSGWISDGATVHIDGGNATATLLHMASSSQALLIDIQGSFDDNDIVTDASSNTLTLSNNGAPAIATAEIDGTWTSADTTAVTIDDWTTATSTYVRIYTTDAARHNGKWDESKYRLEAAQTNGTIDIRVGYVRIVGLQVKSTNSYRDVIKVGNNSVTRIFNNILQGPVSTQDGQAGIEYSYAGTGTLYAINNIIYNNSEGIYSAGVSSRTLYLYNNTLIDNSANGIVGGYNSGITNLKNNLANGNGTDYALTNVSGVEVYTTNLSEDTTSPNNNYDSKVVIFADEANDDFHLAGSDTAARDAGTDLSGDSNLAFDDDIDGEGRGAGGAWDIGADEKKRATIINAPLTNKLTDGLVGHWTFNGQDMDWASSTAEVLDRSGNSNNGDVTNFDHTSVARGISGQALELDGSNDHIVIGEDVTLRVGESAGSGATYSAWINRLDPNPVISEQVVHKKGLDLYIDTMGRGRCDFDYTTLADFYGDEGSDITDGNWHNVVCTHDGSVSKIYVDGNLNDSAQRNDTLKDSSSKNLYIGVWDGGLGWPYNGKVDEVRVYNRALTAEEVEELYRAGARRLQPDAPMTQKQTGGLVGLWTFNGQDMDWASTTAEVLDRSGNSNNGNVTNFDHTSVARGISGQALEFDGVDDYIQINKSLTSDFNYPATYSMWVNPVSFSSEVWLFDFGYNYTPNKGIGIRYQNTPRLEIFVGDDVHYYGDVLSTNVWQHLVVTFDNSPQVTVYVDGQLVAGPTSHIANTGIEAEGYIGRQDGNNNSFNGTIDEVRVYNRALSAEEVEELYRAGAGRFKLK